MDSILLEVAVEVVEGNPDLWTLSARPDRLVLGPGPTTSTGDVDRDGDVDGDDLVEFERCFSGPGVIYPDTRRCVGFDFDGDLDVDDLDRAQFLSESTGSRLLPVRGQVQLSATVASGTPEQETVRVRVTVTNPVTRESHSGYMHVTKQSHALGLDTYFGPDLIQRPDTKLVFGRTTLFSLDLTNQGADTDLAFLSVEPVSGFSFRFLNGAGVDQRLYLLGRVGSPADSFPPAKRTLHLLVTTPAGWPRRSEQVVTVEATSLFGRLRTTRELKVIKAALLWTPSDLHLPRGRRHNVRPGSRTTYLLTVTNIFPEAKTFRLFSLPADSPPGWNVELSEPVLVLAPGQRTEVEVGLTSPSNASVGSVADWDIALTDAESLGVPGAAVNVVRVGAEVTAHHKIIQIGVDGLPPEYMHLNRKGTGPGSEGDWLMPSLRELMEISTTYTNARVLLPSFTDANHVNALTGSLTGTSGASSVIVYFYGEDEDMATVTVPGDESILRHGPHGDDVASLFDVAKLANPRAYTAMALGKNWLEQYFSKEELGVDLVLNGQLQPFYCPPPARYVLGDPPSDEDASEDPPSRSQVPEWGVFPGLYPDDRWVIDQSIRIIRNEDPDVFYIQPAHCDDVQHLMGTAWDPAEWDDQGTPSTWDDISRIHPLATREEVLDVVRELDHLVGELIEFLRQRGTLDDTFIVLHADHGLITQAPATADIRRLLEPAGFTIREHYYAGGGGGFILIYNVDPAEADEFESVLEHGPPIVPGEDTNPWIVINREEMRTGVDTHTGRVWGLPGELYSEFFIENEIPTPDQQRWPSFFVFLDGHWQGENLIIQSGEDAVIPLFVGSHGGFATRFVPLILHGPGIPRGQVIDQDVTIADVAPTLYRLQGWTVPGHVDGRTLPGLPAIPSAGEE